MDIKALVKRNQVTSESSEKMLSSMEDRTKADYVWQEQSDIWGEQWIRERGSEPSSRWISNLSSITDQHIQRGVNRTLSERLNWPPTLPQFLALCLDFDTTDAFNRMINRKPVLDDVEYYTRQDCGYRCKRVLDDVKARALFNKTFVAKLELKRKGKLPIRDQKLLAEVTVTTEIDRQISDRESSSVEIKLHKARMARIKAGKLNKQ